MANPSETAFFAGGCFWGTEYFLSRLPGVLSTEVGYMGGHLSSPAYTEVKKGKTGHLETVKVIFDPKLVSYDRLTRLFFEIHDPTQTDGQGVDLGPQYLSAVFYTSETQKQTAELLIGLLEAKGLKIATKLMPAADYLFWPAEAYHQKYLDLRQEEPECHVWVRRF